jgi:alpha-mannosidase
MFFLGVSDHGGGPTSAGLRAVDELAATAGHDVAFSTPDAYFAAAAAEPRSLPVVRGDLHLHAVGCYSAVAWIKAANARAEEGLVGAEKLAAAAAWQAGRSLGLESELRRAWQRVLFNQFHDTLGGTCTEQAFESVASFYGEALSVAEEVTTRATQILAMRTDTWVEGADAVERVRSLDPFAGHFPLPVVIFNPLSWQVHTPIAIPHPASRASLEGGAPIPLQEIASGEATRYERHSLVLVDLPPLGHRVVRLHEPNPGEDLEGPRRASDASGARATAAGLQSDLLSVDLDRTAGVISAIRPRNGRAVIQPEGIRPVVLDDPSDTWSHGVVRYEGEEKACDLVDAQVVESGPVRALWRLSYRWDASTIDLDVALHHGVGYVDLVVRSDWRQRRQLLKLVIPLAVEEPRVTVGVPYGAVERDAYPGEEVMHHWLDVSSAGGGVTCSADVTYGYDLVEGRLRLTVLRSPLYADHGRPWADDRFGPAVTDQGLHVASYRLMPHSGWGQSPARRMADEHRTRFPIVAETWHTGSLGSQGSALDVSPDNVAVSAVKRAESDRGWVVRLLEIEGRPATADLRIPPLDRAWAGRLGPYEVLTLLVPDEASRPIREVDLAEFDVPAEQDPGRP